MQQKNSTGSSKIPLQRILDRSIPQANRQITNQPPRSVRIKGPGPQMAPTAAARRGERARRRHSDAGLSVRIDTGSVGVFGIERGGGELRFFGGW